MPRVVMFTNTFSPMVGGLERSVADAHRYLNSNGHFCRVVTPGFRGAKTSGAGILRVPALTGVGEQDFSVPLPAINRLECWMEAIEPQVVHAHQPFLLGDTAWQVAQLRRIPLVFTHHTLYERYAHYLPLEEDRARRLLIELTTQYANRCQLIIAPTVSVRSLLLERGITTPIEVSPSGIDLGLYSNGSRIRGRNHLGLSPEDAVVGHLGRISQEKNMDFLTDAMIRVLLARPRTKWLLVGNGDALAAIRQRFTDAGLGNRLLTPGVMEGSAIADAYSAMDVFAFASKTDTQGLVLAEAMAAGVPIVALDAPGTRDCVTDGHAGRLLPATADACQFADAVVSLFDDHTRRQLWANHAREVSLQYDIQHCTQRLVALYQQALENFRPQESGETTRWEQLTERLDVEWTPFWEKLTTTVRALSVRGQSDEAE